MCMRPHLQICMHVSTFVCDQGVALARRKLRKHGQDVCVVLEAVGVDTSDNGRTVLNR